MESIADLLRPPSATSRLPKKGIVFRTSRRCSATPSPTGASVDELAARGADEDRPGGGHRARGLHLRGPARLRARRRPLHRPKPGKLPWETIREAICSSTERMARAATSTRGARGADPGRRRLLATGRHRRGGGTARHRQGAELVGYAFVSELAFLHGASRLAASSRLAGDLLGGAHAGPATKYEAVPVLSAWDETPSLRALRVGLGRSPRATPSPDRW